MKNFTKYIDFEVEQWLEDSDFVSWVKNPTAESNAYFTTLMAKNTLLAQKMDAAAQLLRKIGEEEPTLSDREVENMWENIKKSTFEKPKQAFFLRNWIRVAAVAAVLVSTSWAGLSYLANKEIDYAAYTNDLKVDSTTDIKLLMPDKSQMTLSNKSEVVLNNNEITVRTAKGDHISFQNKSSNNTKMLQLVVPKGKQAAVVLADGSKVTVRPGSKVVFPSCFAEKRREMYAEGEVFLEVTKNSLKPFIVKTGHMHVEVLGTSFNVSAYPNENVQSVVLVTGSVKVGSNDENTVKITPNQRYAYNKNEKTETVNEVDVYPYISWKDGVLSCNSERLSDVFKKLSDYYGVNFNYNESKLANMRITGKLDLNQNIENVLKTIATTSPIKYNTTNNCIQINVKP